MQEKHMKMVFDILYAELNDSSAVNRYACILQN